MYYLARRTFATENDWKLFNKVAHRILPIILIQYIISFLDRINIGFAKLHMAADIGLSNTAFGVGAGIFFVGYCIFEIPSNMLLARLGAKLWLSAIMVVWGAIEICMFVVRDTSSFYTMRFLLGIAEAGFYPGLILYLTYWFPGFVRSQVQSFLSLGIALAGLVGGPLSGWIMQTFHNTLGLADWQWLFILEGIPAVLVGIFSWFYLDNGPSDVAWLDESERTQLIRQLKDEQADSLRHGAVHDYRGALLSPTIWCLIGANFALLSLTYGISFWLPQIIKELGVAGMKSNGLMAAIPYAFAGVVMFFVSQHSDMKRERRWHSIISLVCAAAGLVMAALCRDDTVLSMIGISVALAGTLSGFNVVWAMPSTLLSAAAAPAGIALMATVGNLGGYVSPFAIGWLADTTGQIYTGLYFVAAIAIAGALCIALMPRARIDATRMKASTSA
ncbi:MFS transporter [Pararobbsia silviterrae]|uniref:MFS transporter n=1 Tax=Pararobbsia silviterrae TaxID=1792498 RepID=A0A494Y2V9_9BURK|nr:MFS transporter [Pararobbsia silviterrae]RKP56629.1 MFS transporter [Pararobbsia silviterrae]